MPEHLILLTHLNKMPSISSQQSSKLTTLLKAIGPGLVFAGTSIGVSHIVQSTRAGANYGFGLLWAVIFINIFKFPFFEFAPRYVNATGQHLLQGYRRVGKWAFYLFFILSLCTMFPIQSAVTLVCTGLFSNLVHWPFQTVHLSAIILVICCTILLLGKYPLLDRLMKIMVIVLAISTLMAFVAALIHGSSAKLELSKPFLWNVGGISFLVALMGWMPTTLEISVWHSLWSVQRQEQTKYKPRLREALFDFHLGYWGTMILAVLFLSLGALTMYGTGEEFSNSAVKFTGQVISIYTKALGPWAYWIIAIAAATTMFSTTICCLDAFPRVIREALIIIFPSLKGMEEQIYTVGLIVISLVSVIIIGGFVHRMKLLIDFATILAFMATPVFAYINLRTVTDDHIPQEYHPSKRMQIFAWISLFVLTSFSIFFIVWRFFIS